MKEITDLKTIQGIELEALQFIDTVCKERGLRYFLAGGTLLGAVRHKGFIPWDNDVDIALPRKDYEEFIRIIEQEYTDTPYCIARIKDNNDYFYGFAKLYDSRTLLYEHAYSNAMNWLGVYIDLFPLDGLGSDLNQAKSLFHHTRRITRRICLCKTMAQADSIKEKIGRVHHHLRYGRLIGRERSLESLVSKLCDQDFDHSAYIASTYGLRSDKEILPQELFRSSSDVEFEGLSLPAPVGWHEYLKAMYGDYMQLPPEEERTAGHNISIYLKDGETI